jgi:hypothetical protein
MTKKKKATTRPTAKKKSATKKKKQVDAAQVREDLAGIVKSEAKSITEAVMDQAMHGELAPAKYLLELAGVYPPANEGEQATEEEDCLAKTLLDRLNISRKAPHNEHEEETEKDAGSGDEGEVKVNDPPVNDPPDDAEKDGSADGEASAS